MRIDTYVVVRFLMQAENSSLFVGDNFFRERAWIRLLVQIKRAPKMV